MLESRNLTRFRQDGKTRHRCFTCRRRGIVAVLSEMHGAARGEGFEFTAKDKSGHVLHYSPVCIGCFRCRRRMRTCLATQVRPLVVSVETKLLSGEALEDEDQASHLYLPVLASIT